MTTRPLPSPLSNQTLVAQWDDHWQVHRLDLQLPLRGDVGAWLIRKGLYARGSDFTSAWAETPNYQGNSTLKQMWKGVWSSRTSEFDRAQVWVLVRKDVPQGVVVRTHPSSIEEGAALQWFERPVYHMGRRPTERVQVARLGHVMAFVKPAHRRQGLVRRTLMDFVVAGVEADASMSVKQGALPIIGASDALFPLLGKLSGVPTVQYLGVCQAMRSDVWSLIDKAAMYPERTFPFSPYLVPGEPCPKPERKRALRK